MNNPRARLIRFLISRLARLDNAMSWTDELNPTQSDVLGYLARSNRFSRSPSHIADYMGTTRGTMSQTLKALVRKGYIRDLKSPQDKRSISFGLTEKGQQVVVDETLLETSISQMLPDQAVALELGLKSILNEILQARNGRAFGVCRSCQHHRADKSGFFCQLMSLPLKAEDADKICYEHAASAV